MRTSEEIPDFVGTEYLSASQLASNFGWPESFINELVSNARLPGIKTGGIWNFRRDDVIDWLEQRIQTLDSQRVGQLETRVEHSLVADGSYRRPIAPDRLVSRMPDDGSHLFGLARVARILHQGGLEKLKQARTAAQLKLAITSVEGKLSARIY